MAKILFTSDDRKFLEVMKKYLGWYGFDIDILFDSSEVISKLNKGEYDLLISSVFSKPIDGYLLVNLLRDSKEGSLRDIPIILTAPEEPEPEKYVFLKKKDVYFMNKYGNCANWHEKINTVLLKSEEISDEE